MSYRHAEPAVGEGGDLDATKIHIGRCEGLEVCGLAPEQFQAFIQNWLPTANANPKPTTDDRRLIAALETWAADQEKANDDKPF